MGWMPPVAFGQGLLVDSRPDHGFRLPRPYPWPHPHPHPIPRPRPLPQTPQAYRIKQLSVNVNLTDQVAKVFDSIDVGERAGNKVLAHNAGHCITGALPRHTGAEFPSLLPSGKRLS